MTRTQEPEQLMGGEATQANTFRALLKSWVDKVDVLVREGRDMLTEMSVHGEQGPLAAEAYAHLEGWLDDLAALVESGGAAQADMDPYLTDFDRGSRRLQPTALEDRENAERVR